MVDCSPSVIYKLSYPRDRYLFVFNLSPSGKSFIDKAIESVTVRSNMPRVRNFGHISSLWRGSRLKAAIDSIGKIRY